MMKIVKNSISIFAVSVGMGMMPLSQAMAQQMDYGSLEALFNEPVTTSATGKPQRASESPVNIEIITAEDIRRTGARSIPEVLQHVVGMDVWQSAVNNFDVGIRGSNSYYNPTVLVMVNDRQVYVDDYGYTSWGSIPVAMSDIRQIEVVKGPNTALFGFNAVAGVINIITYNPLYDDVDNVTTTVGSGPDQRVSVVQSMRVNQESGVKVSAGRMRASDFGSGNTQSVDIWEDGVSGRFVNLDSRWKISDRTTMLIGMSHNLSHLNELPPTFSYGPSLYEVNSINFGTVHETNDWGTIDFSIYHNAFYNEARSALGSGVDIVNKVTVAKVQDVLKIGGNHTVRVAGEFRHNRMENLLSSVSDTYYNVYSTSAMWDWAINPDLSWTNAVRVDKLYLGHSGVFEPLAPYTNADFDQDLTSYSVNSGVVYKLEDGDAVGANYGRGIQVPSLLNFGALDFTILGNYIGGNPRLNPTVSQNYEVNYTHTFGSSQIADQDVDAVFKTALFYKTFDDLIGGPARLTTPHVYQNTGSSQSTGIELSLKGHVNTDWRWGVNYTYEVTQDDIHTVAGVVQYESGFEKTAPRHLANLNLGYSQDDWEADAFFHYVSARDMLRDTTPLVILDSQYLPVDAVYGVSGRVGYHLADGVTLSLNGSNLQSARSVQTSGRNVERAVWAALSFDY